MSGTPVRVAVQEGADTVRVAGAERDGLPWLVAELPTSGAGLPALLAELVGPTPQELVLVHPGSWPPARVARWAQEYAGLAARVRAVPAPLAAAGRGGVAVLDVGAAGAEAALLDTDGLITAWTTAQVGGRLLDELVAARFGRDRAAARAVREALSLLRAVDGIEAVDVLPVLAEPLGAAVSALRDVLAAAGKPPVLLVGGVARSPLLARLVDEAGVARAVVPPRPEAAAVLGALTLPSDAGVVATPERATERRCSPQRVLPVVPAPRRRPVRAALLAGAAAATVVALLAIGRLVVPAAADAVPAGILVQYGYQLDVPAGWEHTGGQPEHRRVLLTPLAAPDGSDMIAVERSPLGYDTAAEPERAQAELRAAFDAAVAGGSALSGYDPGAWFAGRAVTTYREEEPDRTVVDWFVVLDGDAQLSVGCRHTAVGAEAVRAACAAVVASVRNA
jgi:type VII secretion-associated protein (TIGR03931 family)